MSEKAVDTGRSAGIALDTTDIAPSASTGIEFYTVKTVHCRSDVRAAAADVFGREARAEDWGSAMNRDRRKRTRPDTDRRDSTRVPVFDNVLWRVDGESGLREGVLVGVSTTGLAMLTERPVTPAPGRRLFPKAKIGRQAWQRAVVVTRVDHLSGLLDLVAAEYAPP